MAGETAKGPLEGIGSLSQEEIKVNMAIIRQQLNKGELIIDNEFWDFNTAQADFIHIVYDTNREEYIAKIFFSTQTAYVVFDKNLKPILVELYNRLPHEI